MTDNNKVYVIESLRATDCNGLIVDVHSMGKIPLTKSLLPKHLHFIPAGQNYRQVYLINYEISYKNCENYLKNYEN